VSGGVVRCGSIRRCPSSMQLGGGGEKGKESQKRSLGLSPDHREEKEEASTSQGSFSDVKTSGNRKITEWMAGTKKA